MNERHKSSNIRDEINEDATESVHIMKRLQSLSVNEARKLLELKDKIDASESPHLFANTMDDIDHAKEDYEEDTKNEFRLNRKTIEKKQMLMRNTHLLIVIAVSKCIMWLCCVYLAWRNHIKK